MDKLNIETDPSLLPLIIDFLHSIGIQVVETALPKDTFLSGLHLKGSTILMDRNQLKHPGDLLHEAGHIATTEEAMRPLIGSKKMPADWPNNGNEMATILWSFAAACHLNLDLEIIFHPGGYKNESDWLIEQFRRKNYLGLPLLEWMSLCSAEEFPRMKKWLR